MKRTSNRVGASKPIHGAKKLKRGGKREGAGRPSMFESGEAKLCVSIEQATKSKLRQLALNNGTTQSIEARRLIEVGIKAEQR